MEKKTANQVCQSCKEGKLIEGTLEGVSFQPSSEGKKWLSSGVYGINATVCSNCGCISNVTVDVEALKKLLKK